MVRIPLAIICSILISSAAMAAPLTAVPVRPSLALHVEQPSEGSSASRRVPESCQDGDDRPAWCAPYPFRTEEQNRHRHERRPAPLARTAPGPAQLTAAAKPVRGAPAGRLLSEQERNFIALRPLTPARIGGDGKAPSLGKTPEEKLRHMIGRLMLTGFSGRAAGRPGCRAHC